MKTNILKQEILLVITVSQKEPCIKNASESFHVQSPAEQLEEACWNGLFDELVGGLQFKSYYKQPFKKVTNFF